MLNVSESNLLSLRGAASLRVKNSKYFNCLHYLCSPRVKNIRINGELLMEQNNKTTQYTQVNNKEIKCAAHTHTHMWGGLVDVEGWFL